MNFFLQKSSFFFLLLLLVSCQSQEPSVEPVSISKVLLKQAYGKDSAHIADVYFPEKLGNKSPVLLLVHGGAWYSGDKSDIAEYVQLLQKQYPEATIFNANYRLADGKNISFHQQNLDLKDAIAFVNAHKQIYNLSDNIGLVGFSSGAQLVMDYIYNDTSNTTVKCIADLYSPTDLSDPQWYSSYKPLGNWYVKDALFKYLHQTLDADTLLYKQHSPLNSFQKHYVPTVIFHGTSDPIVPFSHSQSFADSLKKYDYDYQFYIYPNEMHGFSVANKKQCIGQLVSFFKNHL